MTLRKVWISRKTLEDLSLQHTPDDKMNFINYWFRVWGMFQGYVGKCLEKYMLNATIIEDISHLIYTQAAKVLNRTGLLPANLTFGYSHECRLLALAGVRCC